jgi:hypothetical protein
LKRKLHMSDEDQQPISTYPGDKSLVDNNRNKQWPRIHPSPALLRASTRVMYVLPLLAVESLLCSTFCVPNQNSTALNFPPGDENVEGGEVVGGMNAR